MMTLLYCLNGWCQNDINDSIPLRRDNNKVLIDINYIRLANKKLIEHKYCNIIINNKDSIISLERNKYLIADSLYKIEYNKYYNNVKVLEKQLSKQRKRNRILSYSTIGGIAFSVLILLIK